MTEARFLMEWAIRSSILILSGALVLLALRVKSPPIRLAALVVMLFGSLGIPALTALLPQLALPTLAVAPRRVEIPGNSVPMGKVVAVVPGAVPLAADSEQRREGAGRGIDWAGLALGVYLLVAAALLMRLGAGLVLSRRLLGESRPTGRVAEGVEIRESNGLATPVTLGILRSVIVLPADWREWDGMKLDAVVAHESSHIRRKDPAVQFLSALHRALLWHSPLSWFLHRQIVRVAEEASDDAALAVTADRETYAELLLDFMARRVRRAGWRDADAAGVAMARYGRPAERISRVLDGTSLSRGLTRWSEVAVLACGSVLAYVVAAAQPQTTPTQVVALAGSARSAMSGVAATAAQQASEAGSSAQTATDHPKKSIRRYMIVSGDTMSGSWDSGDREDVKELRETYGRNFVWFRQGRTDYVVTDSSVLAEIDKAMAPQREVNRKQNEVNKQQDVVNQHQEVVNQHQEAVNQHQEAVNRVQNEVNAMQEAASRRQDLINQLQEAKGDADLVRKLEAALAELRARKNDTADQSTVNSRQTEVNAKQELVNQEQNKVNQEQGRVNDEQGNINQQQDRVNEEQHRVSALMEGRVEDILDSAVRRHLAQPLK